MQSPPKLGEWWLTAVEVDYHSEMGEVDDTYYAEVMAANTCKADGRLKDSHYDVQDVGEEDDPEIKNPLSRSII